MKFDAVVLDLDGTLLNTIPDIAGVVNEVTGNIGMAPFSEERIRSAVGSGVETLLQRLGVPGQWIGPLSGEISSRYAGMRNSKATVYPGIEAMLDEMFESVGAVCVLSNKPQKGVVTSLRDHLPGYRFTMVTGAMPGKPAKPEPDELLRMAGELNADPARILMVGDGEPDILAAKAAGCVQISVLWGYRNREQLESAGGVNFASSPGEVLEFMELIP